MSKNVAALKMRQLNITRIADGDKSNNFRIEDAQYVIQEQIRYLHTHTYIWAICTACNAIKLELEIISIAMPEQFKRPNE